MQNSPETIGVGQPAAPRSGRRRRFESVMPALARLRGSPAKIAAHVRASVPLRTVLFVLPAVVIPPLAFELSPLAMVLVPIGLLWLAAASAILTTLMIDGVRDRRLTAISERLDQLGSRLGPPDRPDGLDERLEALAAEVYALNQAISSARNAGRSGRSRGSVDYDEGRDAPTQQFDNPRGGRPKYPDNRRRDERWR